MGGRVGIGARQYVNKDKEVRWFTTDVDVFRSEGVIWSRIPTIAKVKSQLAYASQASGEEINVENSDIGVVVPDAEGSSTRVSVHYNHDRGEWE
jgi:hypothetical protein